MNALVPFSCWSCSDDAACTFCFCILFPSAFFKSLLKAYTWRFFASSWLILDAQRAAIEDCSYSTLLRHMQFKER